MNRFQRFLVFWKAESLLFRVGATLLGELQLWFPKNSDVWKMNTFLVTKSSSILPNFIIIIMIIIINLKINNHHEIVYVIRKRGFVGTPLPPKLSKSGHPYVNIAICMTISFFTLVTIYDEHGATQENPSCSGGVRALSHHTSTDVR